MPGMFMKAGEPVAASAVGVSAHKRYLTVQAFTMQSLHTASTSRLVACKAPAWHAGQVFRKCHGRPY